MARILVPDEPDFSIHAAIRSLVRSGHTCEAAGSRGPLIRRMKMGRYIDHFHHVASPAVSPDRFVDELRDLASRSRIDILMPFSQRSCTAIVPRQKLLEGLARFLFPEPEAFEVANDKLLTARHCRKIGVSCPKTYEVRSEGDLGSVARDAGFPVVLKPRSESAARSVRMAADSAGLMHAYEDLCTRYGQGNSYIAQEFIPGFIHDVCTVSRRGKVLQVLTQVRKLMFPVDGGVGATVFTTSNPPLSSIARRVLESLRWNGPAQIEFKFDERDGAYKLIEINPRFWGSLDLSRKAGIDFPSLVCDVLLGRPVTEDRPYPAGVRYQFLFSRGILARLQMMNSLGMQGLRDPQTYSRTHFDLDILDPLPELMRVMGTMYIVMFEKALYRKASLPGCHINSMNRHLHFSYSTDVPDTDG